MIAKRIDRIVDKTKWPVAVLLVLVTPFVLHAFGLWLMKFWDYPIYTLAYGVGIVAVVLLCRSPIAESIPFHRVIAFERDLTQTILAFLMLHPVVGYGERQRDNSGTRVRWLGRGNWLMLAAPYFFPTATVVLWLLSWLLLSGTFRCFVIGIGVAYHVAAVIVQCKSGTKELRRLGSKYCWIFLPTANLIVVSATFAFALEGFSGLYHLLLDVFSPISGCFVWLWTLIYPATSAE